MRSHVKNLSDNKEMPQRDWNTIVQKPRKHTILIDYLLPLLWIPRVLCSILIMLFLVECQQVGVTRFPGLPATTILLFLGLRPALTGWKEQERRRWKRRIVSKALTLNDDDKRRDYEMERLISRRIRKYQDTYTYTVWIDKRYTVEVSKGSTGRSRKEREFEMKVLKIELPARDFVGVPEDDVGTIRGFPRSVFRNENEKILSIEESTPVLCCKITRQLPPTGIHKHPCVSEVKPLQAMLVYSGLTSGSRAKPPLSFTAESGDKSRVMSMALGNGRNCDGVGEPMTVGTISFLSTVTTMQGPIKRERHVPSVVITQGEVIINICDKLLLLFEDKDFHGRKYWLNTWSPTVIRRCQENTRVERNEWRVVKNARNTKVKEKEEGRRGDRSSVG
ncbi:hypothetical protein V1477_010817 [Vespula maculifrons]|uniref:Uncharacterized protein n=1 Tax=Vespula maculifrons TaxID=7453 RepID=A0ABD2C4V5_VESMC